MTDTTDLSYPNVPGCTCDRNDEDEDIRLCPKHEAMLRPLRWDTVAAMYVDVEAGYLALLAEVDRLTASGPAQVTAAWNWAIEHERVRILAEVEGLDIYPGSRGREVAGGYVRRAAVIAAIKGEATDD